MQYVRIVEIPKMKAAYSGPLTDEAAFEAFNTWLKSYDDAMHMEMEPICIVERDPAEIENNAEDKLAKTMKKKLALTEDSSESHEKTTKTTE